MSDPMMVESKSRKHHDGFAIISLVWDEYCRAEALPRNLEYTDVETHVTRIQD